MSAALYHALILAHDKAPRRAGPLDGATHTATLDNPLCGDLVIARAIIDKDTIRDIALEARGCAVSRAAASMLADRAAGARIEDLRELADLFARFIAEPPDAPVPEALGDLAAFAGLRAVRSRRTCGTLPFRALLALAVPDVRRRDRE